MCSYEQVGKRMAHICLTKILTNHAKNSPTSIGRERNRHKKLSLDNIKKWSIINSVIIKRKGVIVMNLENNNHSVFLLNYHLVLVVKYRRKVIDDVICARLRELFERIAPNINILKEGLRLLREEVV